MFNVCQICGEKIDNEMNFCPRCGGRVNINERMNQNPDRLKYSFPVQGNAMPAFNSIQEINGVQFNIEDIQKGLIIKTAENVANKVRKICKCDKMKAEEAVFGYFFKSHGNYFGNIDELRSKIAHTKSWNGKKLYCPYCLSTRLDTRETITESVSKGRSEVRKKSAITRAGNKAGRAGMIMMTGGLWALTPKKSKYNEVSEGKTTYHTSVTKTCMDCGREIK